MPQFRLYVITLFSIFSIQTSFGQVQILTADTSICPGECVLLEATNNGRVPNVVAGLQDDRYTGVINFNFPFSFYGNTYTACVFSTNGYISFNTANATLFSNWNTAGPIPGNGDMLNSIAAYFADIYPPAGGTLDWAVTGTAPNRRFILSFCDVPMFSCTNLVVSFQVILNETSNIIDMHITSAPGCNNWPSIPGVATQGVQNANGTAASTVAGRNYQSYTAFKSSHRFTPTGTTGFTVSPIPYDMIPNANATVFWYENGTNFIGNGDTITVCPSVNTFYVARTVDCSDTTADTVYINMNGLNFVDSFSFIHPTICGKDDGRITLFGVDTNTTFTINYDKNGVAQPPISATSSNLGTLSLNALTAGTYSNIIPSVLACTMPPTGPIVLINPQFVPNFDFNIKFGCDADTVQYGDSSLVVGNYVTRWQFGDGNISIDQHPKHIFLNQNIYTTKLIIDNGYCKDSLSKAVDVTHALIADFTADPDSVCQHAAVTFTNTSTAISRFGIDPAYSWDFGDGHTSFDPNPTHTFDSAGIFEVRLIVTDFVPCSDTIIKLMIVDPTPEIATSISDSFFCEGATVKFSGIRSNQGLIKTWWDFGDGTIIFNQDTLTHSYDTSGNVTAIYTAQYRFCGDRQISMPIQVNPQPIIDIGADTAYCPGSKPLMFNDLVNGSNPNATWLWNNGDTTPNTSIKHHGKVVATVTINGCSSSDSAEVFKDCYLDLPNAFSPNGDDENDFFLPRQLLSKGATTFTMNIFNRWGEKIFTTSRLDGRGWDGKYGGTDQPAGVYIYTIAVSFKNGITEHYNGSVTLLR